MRGLARAAGVAAALAVLGCRASLVPPTDAGRQARQQLAILEEIFVSKNDNDPRLDSEFETLSPAARTLFRDRYYALPAERRNERGTIVYLLGRVSESDEDWAFLRAVAAEPSCLSLADCSRASAAGEDDAAGGDEVTRAYPSLVALRQAQAFLERRPGDARVLAVIAAGAASEAPAVSRLAARIRAVLDGRLRE